MSVLIFFQMLFSATELASFLFAIDETKGMDLMNGTAILGGWTILMPTYLFCQLSENVSVSMQMISDAFYGCAWYCLSAKQQTLFLLPMQRAQKEIRINGLGIVDCSLAVFASVNARAIYIQYPDVLLFVFNAYADHSDHFFIFFALAQLLTPGSVSHSQKRCEKRGSGTYSIFVFVMKPIAENSRQRDAA